MNPYKTLRVSKNATIEEIKKAYRELAKIHHPDKGGDPTIFNEITRAYKILTNSELRNEYDRTGIEPESKNLQFHNELIMIFKNYIFQMINNGEKINIEIISRKLSREIETIEKEIKEIKVFKKYLENRKNDVRMKRKNKLNHYEEAFYSIESDINDKLKQLKHIIKNKKKLLKLADNYETVNKSKTANKQQPIDVFRDNFSKFISKKLNTEWL
uniref:Putative chaperone n=1 Tax=viral metagenome TaxID=1070528 RepID=A0A6M3IFB6_9ZZZZ